MQDSNRSGRGFGFWEHIGSTFRAFMNHFGSILGHLESILIAIWVHFKAFQENFNIILGTFWEHFDGPILIAFFEFGRDTEPLHHAVS